MYNQTVSLPSRIAGAFAGVAIGDARGLPFETKTPVKVAALRKQAPPHGFLNPMDTISKAWLKHHRLQVGSTSDDTQLTFAVARSLLRMKGFDIEDIAREHLIGLKNSDFGWGRSTRAGILELSDWAQAAKSHSGRTPAQPRVHHEGQGGGNGVAMKVMPLALWASMTANRNLLSHRVQQLASLTHTLPSAAMAAYMVALCYGGMFNGDLPSKLAEAFPETNMGILARAETLFRGARPGNGFIWHMRKLLEPGVLDSAEALREAVGTSVLATESVVFALGVFFRHPTDFVAAVEECIDAGGDTDTTASIVGGLVGFNVGLQNIPEEWRVLVPAVKTGLALASDFHTAFVRVACT